MPFTDNFLYKDKQFALQHRKSISEYLEASVICLDKFELDKSKQYFDHAMALLGELRRMNLEKITSDGANQDLSDNGLRIRRDYF